MYLIYFYVPKSHLESVKSALFTAGAGKMGRYELCCWQVKGRGQFKPLENAKPFLGQPGQLEHIDEYRVEMVFEDRLKPVIITALRESHPYEEPAYGIIKLET